MLSFKFTSMATLIHKDRDISQFSNRLSIVLGIVFLIELLKLDFIALLLSIGGQGYLLFFCFTLFGEFKSDYPKLILVSVFLSFLSELAILFNLDYAKEGRAFWVFIICHFIRDIVLAGKFLLNIIQSDIYNYFWIRVLPFPCVGALFLILQFFIFGKETDHFFFFLLYDVVICLPLLTSASRYNHTSYNGFFVMVLGTLALVLSEVFYFIKIMETPEEGSSIGFRATFLLVGNILIMISTYDHVTEFEKESRHKIYFGGENEDTTKVGRKKFYSTSKPLGEPLI